MKKQYTKVKNNVDMYMDGSKKMYRIHFKNPKKIVVMDEDKYNNYQNRYYCDSLYQFYNAMESGGVGSIEFKNIGAEPFTMRYNTYKKVFRKIN